ncbi:hypothetical protein VARIO8X_110108 [Burkholderiales bacterium 8X]|nr:hypothetical protein VARIO8X_110108 [Burkholderiales bacterium 8X]
MAACRTCGSKNAERRAPLFSSTAPWSTAGLPLRRMAIRTYIANVNATERARLAREAAAGTMEVFGQNLTFASAVDRRR